MKNKIFALLSPIISGIIFIFSLNILIGFFGEYPIKHILLSIQNIPFQKIVLSVIFSLLSYFFLSLIDYISAKNADMNLSYKKTLYQSFLGYSVGNTIHSVLGLAVRSRILSSWGVDRKQISSMLSFSMVSFFTGLLSITLLSSIINFGIFKTNILPFGEKTAILLMILCNSILTFYFVLVFKKIGSFEWKFFKFSIPSKKNAILGLIYSLFDWFSAVMCLYILMPEIVSSKLGIGIFTLFFVISLFSGLITNIPGGLGVFETIILTLLSTVVKSPEILASIIVFRVVYYLIPFILSLLVIFYTELKILFTKVSSKQSELFDVVSSIIPIFFSMAMLIFGSIFLIKGSVLNIVGVGHFVYRFIPNYIVLISDFFISLMGLALIFLAKSIFDRINISYYLTLALFLGIGFFSIIKLAPFLEVLLPYLLFFIFLPSKKYFYRKSSLFSDKLSIYWTVPIFTIGISISILSLFLHHFKFYKTKTLWELILNDNTPIIIRLMLIVLVIVFGISVINILFRCKKQNNFTDYNIDDINKIVEESNNSHATLAYLGDKNFIFSKNKDAFIMYGISGKDAIALFDPIGNSESFRDLVIDFINESKSKGLTPVFYQISGTYLQIYIDLGFTFSKIGEKGRILLENLSIPSKKLNDMKRVQNKLGNEGFSFSISYIGDDLSMISKLKNISDSWLDKKGLKEKSFSLGSFNIEYLKKFPIALIKDNTGEIVAFANLLLTSKSQDMSIDLMRYNPNKQVPGVMDYLFYECILWGQENGYKYFDIGMCPLSGMENAKHGLWNKAAKIIYKHGEYFYNFKGLRSYKNKYNPEWQSMYIASMKNILLSGTIINISTLISGGIKGIISKK